VSVEILPESYRDIMSDFKGHFPFRPGMSATVDIITHRENNILSVPINAVTTREDDDSTKMDNRLKKEIKEYVFVVDSKTNTTSLRKVRTGLQDNQYIQILEGLNDGEQVVTAPFSAIARTLKKDTKVKVVPKEELYSKEKEEDE
jgi:HlyD family secretion protein